jgi:uncharacterized alpha-E superfamily protein
VAVARLIEVTQHLELDSGEMEGADDLWAPLLGPDYVPEMDGASGGVSLALTPRDVRNYLAFASDNPSSLVACIGKARGAARGIREALSSEMWEELNTLYLSLAGRRLALEADDDAHSFFTGVRAGAQFIQGLGDDTLARDERWHFLTLGKYLERADNVARALKLQASLLTPGVRQYSDDQAVRWLAVLRSCGSGEAYAYYYSLRVDPARVIEFLLFNPLFPQSVRFSLSQAAESLNAIARERHGGAPGIADPAVRALSLLRARVENSVVDEVMEGGLEPYLDEIQYQIGVVSNQVTRMYLRDEPAPGRLGAADRAALIMAAQQQ